MPVPETTMNEDDLSPTRENKVRRTWEVFSVETEAVAMGMEPAADLQLGAGILAPHRLHGTTSGLG